MNTQHIAFRGGRLDEVSYTVPTKIGVGFYLTRQSDNAIGPVPQSPLIARANVPTTTPRKRSRSVPLWP